MFLPVAPQQLMCIGHTDTYGIAFLFEKSIPHVSDLGGCCEYPCGMATNNRWLDWGIRLRAHVREQKDVTWAKIARELDQAESAVRHWCNGTRDINLADFFRLCAAAKADPAQILFGRVTITDTQRKQLGDMVVSVLESGPVVALQYDALLDGVPAATGADSKAITNQTEARRQTVVESKEILQEVARIQASKKRSAKQTVRK